MKLTVYSKSVCPFCDHAKKYLIEHNIDFEEIDVEQNLEALDFIRQQGHRTVPQIYHQGQLFVEGGWQGLSKLSSEAIMHKLGSKNTLFDTDIQL